MNTSVAASEIVITSALLSAPHQERSHKKMRALINAAYILLKTREFDDISVTDITQAAEVSIGTFYSRFSSKDNFLIFLGENLVAEILKKTIEEKLINKNWDDHTLFDKVNSYFQLGAAFFTKYSAVLKPMAMAMNNTADPDVISVAKKFNNVVHPAFRRLVLEDKAISTSGDIHQAIEDVLFWASAAVRQLTLYQNPRSAAERKRLVEKISQAAAAYLAAEQKP